jgi:hypothetical protein
MMNIKDNFTLIIRKYKRYRSPHGVGGKVVEHIIFVSMKRLTI